MFDLPLHPILVHFPIALAFLIPLVSFILYFLIKQGAASTRSWILIVILSASYLLSSVVAVQMGERDEEKVEKIVGHDALEEHEEIGEKIPWVAGALLAASLLPLFVKNSSSFQIINIIVGVMGLLPVVKAGHTGGELIYKRGAAKAFTGSIILPKVDSQADKYMIKSSQDNEDKSK